MQWMALLACLVACVLLAEYFTMVENGRGVILCGVALLIISAVAFALYFGKYGWERQPTAFDQVREEYGYLND